MFARVLIFTRHVNSDYKSDTTAAAVFTSSTKLTEDGSKEGLRNAALLLLISVVDIRHITVTQEDSRMLQPEL